MTDRIRRHRMGEVSSKYGYQPELFERDLEQHATESARLTLRICGICSCGFGRSF